MTASLHSLLPTPVPDTACESESAPGALHGDTEALKPLTTKSPLVTRVADIAGKIAIPWTRRLCDRTVIRKENQLPTEPPASVVGHGFQDDKQQQSLPISGAGSLRSSAISDSIQTNNPTEDRTSMSTIRNASTSSTIQQPPSSPRMQRSISSTTAPPATTALEPLSRASTSSCRSISAASLNLSYIHSQLQTLAPSTVHQTTPKRPSRQPRYLANHPSVINCHRYSPFPHRSFSLPPVLESELYHPSAPLTPTSERDGMSVFSGISDVSTISRASRVNSLGHLYINGPDHKGWTKIVADYQIKEVISTPSPTRNHSRVNSFTALTAGDGQGEKWQLDGPAESDTKSEKSWMEQERLERRYKSSDSDRVTRGSSELGLWRSEGEGSECCGMDEEERGKEEEWERREAERRLMGRKDHRHWREGLAQMWERARCWIGFRLLVW